MSIRVTCGECGSQLKVKDELAGKKGHCPKCRAPLVIPASDPDEALDDIEIEVDGSAAARETVAVGASTENTQRAFPVPGADDGDLDEAPALLSGPSSAAPTAKPKPKPKAKGEDFDPADFLMDGAATKPSPPVAKSGRNAPNLDLVEEFARMQRSEPVMDVNPNDRQLSGTAAVTSGLDTAKMAKQMRKAIRQSNAEERQARKDQQGETVDFAGVVQAIGVQGFGGIALVIVMVAGFYYLSNMAMGGGIKLPPLGYVTGTVTLDGQPLEGATVCFAPYAVDELDELRGPMRPSYATTDAKGFYRMNYIDKHQGVAVGHCRIWLSKLGANGRDVIPTAYSQAAMQTKEVKKGSQTFNFEFTTSTDIPEIKRR